MKRTFRPALTLVFALAACTQPEVPSDSYYRLQIALPAPGPASIFKGTLEVNRFVADGLVAGRPIVYTAPDQPHRVQEYNYHFWIEPPTVLLRDQLVAFLRAKKVADMVTTPEVRATADHVLTGKILRLEKIEGAAPKGVLELELAVRRADGKLVFLDVYKMDVAAENNSVEAAVRALNKALDATYAKFVADLARQ